MWTPPPDFADPPASAASAPPPRHAAPELAMPQQPPMGAPQNSTPQSPTPQSSVPMGAPPPGQSSFGPPSYGQAAAGPPPAPSSYESYESSYDSYDMPQDPAPQDESVAERTMAVWLSDSPTASAAPPGTPPDGRDVSSYQTPVYGTQTPHQDGGGPGRNETAILPEPQPQQPGGWQQEGWQPESWQQQGPGGYDPGLGGGPGGPPPHRQQGGASKPLVFTVVGLVAVALVAAVIVLWPDGGDKSPGSASPSKAAADSPAATPKINSVAHREALAVNKVLNASAASRGELARAIAAAGRCKGLPTAITGFERVATQRQSQMAHTRALRVGRLANGARLRQTLGRSIQYSLAVDQALLTWARGRQGCHGKPKPDANFKRAGGSLSAQASAAKSQFAALWAPVAKQHHLPARTATSF